MRINLNKNHPRHYDENGKGKKISLCLDIGVLRHTGKDKKYTFDVLGVGISVYFKLLKGLTRVLFALCILSLPLFYIYSCGNSNSDAYTSVYIPTMLGNLGQNENKCMQQNLRKYKNINVQCAKGSIIDEMKHFGVQEMDLSSDC